jgi:2-aminoethylphosphonate-pyruvate transaminase
MINGMRQMGFQTLLADEVASPIVATFHDPDDVNYSFKKLYDGMKARGFIIFPGRLAAANTFRIACIGIVNEHDIGRAHGRAVRGDGRDGRAQLRQGGSERGGVTAAL